MSESLSEIPQPQGETMPKKKRRKRSLSAKRQKTGPIGYIILILFPLIAFSALFRADFLWTEYDQVSRSPYTEMESWTDAWSLDTIRMVDPITITSYFLEQKLPLPAYTTHRAINLLLHICAVLLLLKLLERFKLPGAYLAALIFAVHPVAVQTLFWPGYRKEIIGLILFLSALYFGISKQSRRDALLFFILGIIAAIIHPIGLTLPIILAGCILYRESHIRLQSFNPILPLLFACVFIALWIQPNLPGFPENIEFSQRAYLIADNMNFFIRQSLLPMRLDLFYPLPQNSLEQHSGSMGLLPFFLFVPFYILFIIFIRKRWSRALILGLSTILCLITYGLLQSGQFIDGTPAHEDHALYVALPAIIALITMGLSSVSIRGGQTTERLTKCLLVLIALCSFSLSTAFAYSISQPFKMWTQLSEQWPDAWQPKAALIEIAINSNTSTLSNDQQTVVLESILESNPQLINHRVLLARIYAKMGQMNNALREYKRILRETEADVALLEEAAGFYDQMGLSWEANNARQRIAAANAKNSP